MLKTKQPKYTDGRTKQSFKDETDINKILKRAEKTGTISHLNKYEARFGDFANFDFFEANLMLTKGREIFDDLPPEIRSEFGQSQSQFFAYVNDPANKDRLGELLPALAAPGRQHVQIKPTSADEAKVLEEADKPAPEPEPKPAAKAPEKPAKPASTPPT